MTVWRDILSKDARDRLLRQPPDKRSQFTDDQFQHLACKRIGEPLVSSDRAVLIQMLEGQR